MRCPVHRGNNPTTFHVNEKSGFARCYSCGWSGGKLDLIVQLGIADDRKSAWAWAMNEMGRRDTTDPKLKKANEESRQRAKRMMDWIGKRKFWAACMVEHYDELTRVLQQVMDEMPVSGRVFSMLQEWRELSAKWKKFADSHNEDNAETLAAEFIQYEEKNGIHVRDRVLYDLRLEAIKTIDTSSQGPTDQMAISVAHEHNLQVLEHFIRRRMKGFMPEEYYEASVTEAMRYCANIMRKRVDEIASVRYYLKDEQSAIARTKVKFSLAC